MGRSSIKFKPEATVIAAKLEISSKKKYGQEARSDVLSCDMSDEFRNLRIIHNRLSSHLLFRLLELRDWNERKLAGHSGIARSVVSAHLSGQRPIRPHHLAAYLRVFDRHERAALLSTWLRENLDQELIADLLEGTKTDSMSSLEENQRRMLDWLATSIARDSKLAKIFSHLTTKAGFKFSSLLLLPVSDAAAQIQTWLLEKASSVWYLLRSLFFRVEHATIALTTLVLALCQRGEVTQQAGEVAEQAGNLAQKAIATSLVGTSFVATALGETADSDFDLGQASPAPQLPLRSSRQPASKGKDGSRAIVKGDPHRTQPHYQISTTYRIKGTIEHEWRRIVAAHDTVHSAFARLIRDAHQQQSKSKHRNQPRN